eukprot:15470768-Alexandrium_andersonii.AAC.1
MVPNIKLHGPFTVLRRYKAQVGRSLAGVVPVDKAIANDILLPASGKAGVTFSMSYLGDAAGLAKEKEEMGIVWMDKQIKMKEAYDIASGHQGTKGVIQAGKYHRLAVRVAHEHAPKLRKALFGREGMSNPVTWRVMGIPVTLATRTQMVSLFAGLGEN